MAILADYVKLFVGHETSWPLDLFQRPDVAKFNFTAKSGPNGVPDWAVAKYADQIKSDALDPASHKADVPAGEIKEIVKRDQSGRERHELVSTARPPLSINS
ncbi:MAG TPA: hypothetical protein VGJ20_20720 [Xanthobacteraceae bacterium]